MRHTTDFCTDATSIEVVRVRAVPVVLANDSPAMEDEQLRGLVRFAVAHDLV